MGLGLADRKSVALHEGGDTFCFESGREYDEAESIYIQHACA